MQDEINEKTIALYIKTGKLTAQTLQKAMKTLLAQMKKQKDKTPQGKQTLKQLMKQNAGVSNIEITEGNIKAFESTAKKYGIDFALKKDTTESPPRYLVFFKGRDADVLTAAFANMSKEGKHISMDTLARICETLNCEIIGVIIATVVGVPMYADIFGTIPIAEALLAKGAQLGVVLSFMMSVTTLSLPSMIMLRKAVKPKLLGVFIAICTIGIILVGYFFNAISYLLI